MDDEGAAGDDVVRRDALAWMEQAEARLAELDDIGEVEPDPGDEEFLRERAGGSQADDPPAAEQAVPDDPADEWVEPQRESLPLRDIVDADLDDLRERGLIDTATISVGAVSPEEVEEADWFAQIWGRSTDEPQAEHGGAEAEPGGDEPEAGAAVPEPEAEEEPEQAHPEPEAEADPTAADVEQTIVVAPAGDQPSANAADETLDEPTVIVDQRAVAAAGGNPFGPPAAALADAPVEEDAPQEEREQADSADWDLWGDLDQVDVARAYSASARKGSGESLADRLRGAALPRPRARRADPDNAEPIRRGEPDDTRYRAWALWVPVGCFVASFILALGAVLVALGSSPGWLYTVIEPFARFLSLGVGDTGRPATLLVAWVIASLVWLALALVAPYAAGRRR